ncbi:predicted protein [Uncinocarpus reesii 1704]|uniref:Myb-like domain-containing protein n=1 Tax=Uncinocarpus reesii (strain UAMH 1704) TaxID=336963 RepID=C4JMP6_UNCRE|nr:uncharacterized protein UREG_04104 [Uncinocarpus reesii 1704]EEP79258.1 predicted protein [Uncinocarpus reesii 1704]
MAPKNSKKKSAENSMSSSASRSGAPAKTPKPRPATRTIVRWNDELDRQLLLSIQSACNSAGIRIPWAQVAEIMGEKITEGAIVQHLAKLRSRMEGDGIPVPPPLRRGGPGTGKRTVSRQSMEMKESPDDDSNKPRAETRVGVAKNRRTERNESSANSNSLITNPGSDEWGIKRNTADKIAAGQHLPTPKGGNGSSDSADKTTTGNKRKAPSSGTVVLRVTPWRLERALMGRDRVNDDHIHVKEEECSSGDESPAGDGHGADSASPSIQGHAVPMEIDSDPQSLLHIGAQHYQDTPQQRSQDLGGYSSSEHFSANESGYNQISSGASSQSLQMNDQMPPLYNLEYLHQASANMYLATSASGALPIAQGTELETPQGGTMNWFDTAFTNNAFGYLDDNFEVGDYISPEYLHQ